MDKNGDRPDKGDRGAEYRSLVGLPGGVNSPLFEQLTMAAENLVSLSAGEGNDGDTLHRANVWVYDTVDFPFHQAEPYHQFHDGFFPGEKYPTEYHDLRAKATEDGRIRDTG